MDEPRAIVGTSVPPRTRSGPWTSRAARSDGSGRLPMLFTVDDAADLLRTTRSAIYAMVERRQLPGVIRVRRRVLFCARDLLNWLDQNRAPSPKE